MAAHTGIEGTYGTTVSISATLPASYDGTGYGTTTGLAWTAIGKVQNFFETGVDYPEKEFVPLSGDIEYTKGAPRYGDGQMVVGDVPADAGQVIVKSASTSNNHHSLKVTYLDGEIHYFDVLVRAWRLTGLDENGQMTRTATIRVCRAPVIVAAA